MQNASAAPKRAREYDDRRIGDIVGLTFKIDRDVRDCISALARGRRMTMSNLVIEILRNHVAGTNA